MPKKPTFKAGVQAKPKKQHLDAPQRPSHHGTAMAGAVDFLREYKDAKEGRGVSRNLRIKRDD